MATEALKKIAGARRDVQRRGKQASGPWWEKMKETEYKDL